MTLHSSQSPPLGIPTFDPPIGLRGYGGFYAGGQIERIAAAPPSVARIDGERVEWPQEGHYSVGQLYAQAFLPAGARPDVQLAFWHGGGMSGAQWEQTPDGRTGWLQMALADRFDCFICDAAERGRAGIPHPALTGEPPLFRSNELAWERFRIGPREAYRPASERPRAHAGQRFPTASFDGFAGQFTARWPGFSDHVRRAYRAFLDRVGAVILIAHSEGARYALESAMRDAGRVDALVLIEPAGAPAGATEAEMRALRDMPVLSVWGDFIDRHVRWQELRGRFDGFCARAGLKRHETLDLNATGQTGHSHFPMLDGGNERVWRHVADWIDRLTPGERHTTPHP